MRRSVSGQEEEAKRANLFFEGWEETVDVIDGIVVHVELIDRVLEELCSAQFAIANDLRRGGQRGKGGYVDELKKRKKGGEGDLSTRRLKGAEHEVH